VGDSPACRDATLLRSRLEPWPTASLRNRLVTKFGETHTLLDPMGRAQILKRLLEHYDKRGPRQILVADGTPVQQDLLDSLLDELKHWVE
jgi:hypothetical protein